MATVIPVLGRMLEAPRSTPRSIDTSPGPQPATESFTGFGQTGSAVPGSLFEGTVGHPVVVASQPKKAGLLSVSSGVSAGLLLAPIRPIYPPIAKAAHVEGIVVIEAIISKTGTIASAHLVSGPAMLAQAALDAIRAAHYQPYRLNGEPTEVQTTITVNFKMGG